MIGQTISHYKILEKLGEGGMGVVYKAEDTRLRRQVALKFLTPMTVGSDVEKARFINEAQAAAQLHHPNICTIYEIDESDGRAFISMALVTGESLDKKIQKGPFPIEESVDIASQIVRGLGAAHDSALCG